jgi:ribosomal protein S13
MLERFELKNHISTRSALLTDLEQQYKINMLEPLNIIFSQINSVNNNTEELKKMNIIRLYLIKSHRGRCHAMGKPVRGQRT